MASIPPPPPKTNSVAIARLPKYTWRLRIGPHRKDIPGLNNATVLQIDAIEECVPNWFHRLMQRWLLGFRWERI